MVRPVKTEEIDRILEIYASAREFMCRSGNPTQWSGWLALTTNTKGGFKI